MKTVRLEIVYYDMLKQYVRGTPLVLGEFLRFYPMFMKEHSQLFATAQYIVHCHQHNELPTDPYIMSIWEVVQAKNVRLRLAWMFVLRQIAFMKYEFLDAYLQHEPNIPASFEDHPIAREEEEEDLVVIDMEEESLNT